MSEVAMDTRGGRGLPVVLAIAGWLAKFVAVVLVIATFNFVLVHAAPGDPAQVIAGQSGAASKGKRSRVNEELIYDSLFI